MGTSKKPGTLSPAEVARRLEVHVTTVRRWFDEGRFPGAYQTATRRIRIPQDDLNGWRMPGHNGAADND